MTSLAADPAPGRDAARRGAQARDGWRSAVSMSLIVLFGLLAPVALATSWVSWTLLDTDRYVATMTPIASDAETQQAAASAVSRAVMSREESNRFLSMLPITGERVESAALAVLDTEGFRRIWIAANREAHRQLVDLLTGQESDGRVVLDLGAIVTELGLQLEVAGRTIDLGDALGEVPVTLVVIESDQLEAARRWVRMLDSVAPVLPLVCAGLLAGGILIAARRWRATRRAALALAIGMAMLGVLLLAGRLLYLDALGTDVPRDAAVAVFDTITRSLWAWTIGLALAGCAIALVSARVARHAA